MTIRRTLTAAAAAALLLTACAGADASDVGDTPAQQPADDAGDEAPADDEPADQTTEDEPDADTEDTADDGTTDDTTADATGADSQLLAVGLRFDGQRVPIAAACNGVDGAVQARTEGEVVITLVREEGTALRYNGEGMIAETADVEVEEVGASTVHRATLASDQVPAVEVEMEIGDTTALPDC